MLSEVGSKIGGPTYQCYNVLLYAVPCHVINVLYSFEEMRFSDTCYMKDIQN